MLITIAVVFILMATLLLVIFNMYSDYKARRISDMRMVNTHIRNAISETEELLTNPEELPFSKALLVILRFRILNFLKRMQTDPNNHSLDEKIKEQIAVIKEIQARKHDDLAFKAPQNDTQAVAQLRAIRKLRNIVHAEMRTGSQVNHSLCQKEDHRLQVLALKVNIANLMQRIVEMRRLHQIGSCRTMIQKGLEVIGSAKVNDVWLSNQSDVLKHMQQDIENEVKSNTKKAMATASAGKANDSKELDEIFGEKKKW
ncbi:MAG: hypothetical protein K6A65_05100 [Succinivibrionaceae bacterium]|nr:hypothetical protein [Succinivibrionaceae bacterium]